MDLTWQIIWFLILLTLGIVLYISVKRLPGEARKREQEPEENVEETDSFYMPENNLENRKDIEELELKKGFQIKSVNIKDNRHDERHLNEYSHDLTANIPWSYGDNKIVLLVKDPNWLFTYWEITNEKKEEIKRNHGEDLFLNSHAVLRVYDVSVPDHANFIDIDINDEARNWYINVNQPNHKYQVVLGRKIKTGMFIPILDSNIVLTPRQEMSNIIDENWPPIPGLADYYAKFKFNKVASSPDLVRKD